MRKLKISILSILMLLWIPLLGACASATGSPAENPAAGQPTGSAQGSGVLKPDYENALPVVSQLALGMIKLDESAVPLSPEQAAQLVPLWKAYRSLSNNETSSTTELDALIRQIQRSLSPEQQQAIAEMKLTGAEMAQWAQEMDIPLGRPGFGSDTDLTEEQQATREALRALRSQSGGGGGAPSGGGPPGGVFVGPPPGGDPGGGFGPPNQATPGAVETAMARRTGREAGGLHPALLEALITFLETKAQ